MPREVARFIQSRFGELRVSEARYEDLLTEAYTHYPPGTLRSCTNLSILLTYRRPATDILRVNVFCHCMADIHHMQWSGQFVEKEKNENP
jgi:predicted Zn-dependent protease with MMP-like domain